MKKKPKIIDLFCGVGGFSLGFEKAGFETIIAIDIFDDAIATYNYNRGKKIAFNKNVEDLTNEELKEISEKNEIDGIIGGPPCQGFSTVGTRDINDPRNHLYKEYCRIVEQVKPRFFVIENVKGLLTLNGGMFKEDIIDRFTNLGYYVYPPQILDAADFGVPQHRHRVFFIGIRDGEFKFPEKHNSKVSTSDAIADLPSLDRLTESANTFNYKLDPINDYQKMMRKGSDTIKNHNGTKHTEQTKHIISLIRDGGKIRDLPKEYWEVRKYNKSFQRMNSQLPSHTIDTGHRNYFHYSENRIPSVRECARIQSFPDSFVFLGSKTSQYKQVGNAVPPLLGYQIAKQLYKSWEKTY